MTKIENDIIKHFILYCEESLQEINNFLELLINKDFTNWATIPTEDEIQNLLPNWMLAYQMAKDDKQQLLTELNSMLSQDD